MSFHFEFNLLGLLIIALGIRTLYLLIRDLYEDRRHIAFCYRSQGLWAAVKYVWEVEVVLPFRMDMIRLAVGKSSIIMNIRVGELQDDDEKAAIGGFEFAKRVKGKRCFVVQNVFRGPRREL